MNNIILNNGVEMPPIVETTNWMDYPVMKKLVTAGMQIGFRAFDTARDYGNEDIVGRVMSCSPITPGCELFNSITIGSFCSLKQISHPINLHNEN